ncbi:MAG: 3-isopropylmalate dehydratase small subunit [Cryomorphaceae bacterium]|jgi:3-isopropylmalate/(R)-2-methylmalate dehydratase small subunit|nr:3-isopropylmalate dehydratase small subunit [Cryomorphaceae bacterium]MDG1889530.1 3-isopropylmalate dehydratase small subunit [Flavobacteriaceae bacterium]MBT3503660.1 3-isopropylmalate dehydratase small subunit [Cryomorphaceae bacterium]MBT3689262.1 3-isopropylmalate dehydratase small subunit [Cryomorphaceae bacterium]MBT4222092.1 3-isopropylmalate dehydratase small subunit [Cryomorphaceae bacterium]
MAYDKFKILNSTAVPLNIDNVDTDQIIPARFLKATERKGFGNNLFRDWRYNSDDSPVESFPLNNINYNGKILIAGKNFGCGSSREHAVWAIYDYGFRVVVSSFFADIFKNNCLNIGVLPIQVSDPFLAEIFSQIDEDPNSTFEVNLENQEFKIKKLDKKERFKISVYKKDNMSNGYDDIDYLLNKKKEISSFANKFIY